MSQWARNNPEQARLEARRADLHMEHWRMTQEGYEDEPEEEPEPVVVAMQEVFAEMDTECRNALRDV
jgi:hypothetical protein